MQMSDIYINEQLNKAQKLLWGGSETENIELGISIKTIILSLMLPTNFRQLILQMHYLKQNGTPFQQMM